MQFKKYDGVIWRVISRYELCLHCLYLTIFPSSLLLAMLVCERDIFRSQTLSLWNGCAMCWNEADLCYLHVELMSLFVLVLVLVIVLVVVVVVLLLVVVVVVL